MLIHVIQSIGPLRRYICKLGENRARFLISFFAGELGKGSKIIDIGAGVCNISRQLTHMGHDLTPLDIRNLSMVDGLKPRLYDGRTIPYPDKHFDSGLLIMVLHHVDDYEHLFDESLRVSKQLIVIEDVYGSWLRKRVTFMLDSLLNLEFRGHPHNNKDDASWKIFFTERGLRVRSERAMGSYLVLRHKVYVLEPIST